MSSFGLAASVVTGTFSFTSGSPAAGGAVSCAESDGREKREARAVHNKSAPKLRPRVREDPLLDFIGGVCSGMPLTGVGIGCGGFVRRRHQTPPNRTTPGGRKRGTVRRMLGE